MKPAPPRIECRLRWLGVILAISAWVLLAHPYEGLRHDGVLYFGQALLHSDVPALRNDVFFASGSQDRYSIYAHLMAPLYARLGLLSTHLGVLMLSWLLSGGAVFALVRRFEPAGAISWWATLAYAVMSPIYGGGWVFSYGEAFVTARSFAEPLLLWSLVALLGDRRLLAVSLQLLAALFHPLMALPIICVGWCYLIEVDRRWLWSLVAIPAVLAAGAAGIPPWDGLLKTYDPYWWALVETGNRQVLIANWSLEDLLTIALDFGILLAAARLRPADAWTRLIYAVIIVTTVLTGLTAVGADVWHFVLLTQLQLWRAHWIAHLIAMALSPWLIMKLWAKGGLWKVSACTLGLALLNSHIGMTYGPETLSVWALSSFAAWRVRKVSPTTVGLACIAILLCILALSAYQLDSVLQQQAWQFPLAPWSDRFIKVAAFPTITVPCFAALLYVGRQRLAGALLALFLSAGLLLAALASWDQRNDLAMAIESAPAAPHPFTAHMAREATVYWPNQLIPVWGLLQRTSHYSKQQGAGVLFNRDTALIFGPRRELYRGINEDRDRCRTGALLSRNREALARCDMPARERLETLCRQPDAPDFLALPDRLRSAPLATWRPETHRDLPQTFFLYACAQLATQGS